MVKTSRASGAQTNHVCWGETIWNILKTTNYHHQFLDNTSAWWWSDSTFYFSLFAGLSPNQARLPPAHRQIMATHFKYGMHGKNVVSGSRTAISHRMVKPPSSFKSRANHDFNKVVSYIGYDCSGWQWRGRTAGKKVLCVCACANK